MTSALLSEALAPVRANASRAAILFDIDGTLAPIVQHAADARVPEGTRQLLVQVARRYRVVACVSGRKASEARAIVAFHWRGAPDEDAARQAVETIAERALEAGLGIHWGRKVLEVRPPVQIDKGAGITSFLEDAGVNTAVYVGDDATDLDAFRALSEMADDGRLELAIRVGVSSDEGPTEIAEQADLVVDGTDGVQELLTVLAAD